MSARNTVKSIQDIMRQDVGVDGDAQRISQLCWMFFLKIVDDQDQELEVTRNGYRSPLPAKYQWRGWAADPEGIPRPQGATRPGQRWPAHRHPRSLSRRLQLHEVRPAHAPGRQQNQRHRLQQPRGAPA